MSDSCLTVTRPRGDPAAAVAGCQRPAAALAAPLAGAASALSAACLAGVLDQLDTGVMVADARGQLLLMNEAARRELAEGGVLRLGEGSAIEVCGGDGLLPLRRAVGNAALGDRRQLLPLRSGTRLLMVAVQPLRAPALGQPCAVLLLGRRQLCPDLVVEMLGRLHDLTPAERRVLVGLLAGQRVTGLARAHGVAVSTVRTQVAALRAKFGVARIDDLTRLVAEMPPMAGALRCARPLASDAGLHG